MARKREPRVSTWLERVLVRYTASDQRVLETPGRRWPITRAMVMILGAQWTVLTIWCWHLYASFDVHVDFAGLSQAWWLMAHGDWNPQITMWHHSFLADHFELISVPLGLLSRVWPYDFWGFMIQNAFIIMGEVGGLLLVSLFARREWWPRQLLSARSATWLTLALFVLNPWIFWAASEDVHFHAIGLAAAGILVLYCALAEKWWWLIGATMLCLSCADVAGPLLLSIGASVLLVGWRRWRPRVISAALIATGFVWIKFVALMGGDKGTNLKLHFGYLLGNTAGKATSVDVVIAILKHPALAVNHFAHAAGSLFGYASAGGILGIFSPLSVPTWLTFLEGGLGTKTGVTFGTISMSPWQMITSIYFIGPTSVVALGWLVSRAGRIATVLREHLRLVIGILLANALLWTAFWVPDEVHNMNLTPPATVAALDHVVAMVPHQNAVFASWSVLGRFGQRRYIHTFPLRVRVTDQLGFRLNTSQVDFVVTPWTGLALEGPNEIGILGALERDRSVKLLYHRAQVWLFSYDRRPGQQVLYVNASYVDVPGVVLPSPTLAQDRTGWPFSGCRSSDNAASGYLVSRLTQHLPVGQYQLSLTVDSTTTLILEVLDDATRQLLARTYNSILPGVHTLNLSFTLTSGNLHHDYLFKGWWPYHFAQLPPLPQDTVEFRLWSPGGGVRSVCALSLHQNLVATSGPTTA